MLAELVFALMIQTIFPEWRDEAEEARRRYAMSIAMYNQFHSPEMIEIRCRVDRLMKRQNTEDRLVETQDYYDILYIKVDPSG